MSEIHLEYDQFRAFMDVMHTLSDTLRRIELRLDTTSTAIEEIRDDARKLRTDGIVVRSYFPGRHGRTG